MTLSGRTAIAGASLLCLSNWSASEAFLTCPMPSSGLGSSLITSTSARAGIATLLRPRDTRSKGIASTFSPVVGRKPRTASTTISSPSGVGPLSSSSIGDVADDTNFDKGSWEMGTSSEEAVTTDLDYTEPEEPSTELAPVLVGGGGGGIGGGGIGGGGGGGGGGIGGGGFGDAGDPATRSSLKQKLLRKVSTLNRGFVAQEDDRVDVEEIVEMLELENPNPRACKDFMTQSSPVAGRWQLLYTTSLDVLSLQINPTVTVGQIFQQIDSDGRAIQNIIELQPPFASVTNKLLGSTVTTLTVKLETTPITDTRINLKFVRTEIQANTLFGRKLDLPALGVDIPSGEKIDRILNKGKRKVAQAKKKARTVAQKAKNKQKAAKRKAEKMADKVADETVGPAKREEIKTKTAEVVDDVKDKARDVADDVSQKTKEVADDVNQKSQEVADDVSDKAKDVADNVDDKVRDVADMPREESRTYSYDYEDLNYDNDGDDGDDYDTSSSSSGMRTPYFETTYVDDDLRVGRTGEGDIYISTRV